MRTIPQESSDDLLYYHADLLQCPRISDEEIHAIMASLAASQVQLSSSTRDRQRAKHRLIEGHLGLAVHMALQVCPTHLRASLLPDMVQEANLAMICAVEGYDWSTGGNITRYLFAWMKNATRHAIAHRHLIKTSYELRRQAEAQGTLETLYEVMEPISLDCLLDETRKDSCPLQEVIADVSLCSPDGGKREQVDQLLSYLTPRAQTAVRLRYGLHYEHDERPRSYPEIAAELGITRGAVSGILGDAMKRLRALARGEARLCKRNGKVCIWLAPARRKETQQPPRSNGTISGAKLLQ